MYQNNIVAVLAVLFAAIECKYDCKIIDNNYL